MIYNRKYFRKRFATGLGIMALGLLFSVTHGYAQTHIVQPRSYYIDSAGNDNAAGTISSPWKTIQKINSVHLNAGDKILFKGGHTFKGTLQPDTDTRIPSARLAILISSYGDGTAILNSANEPAIIIKNKRFISVKKLRLTGSGRKDGNTGDGVAVINCSNILLDDLDVSAYQNAGVNIFASSFVRITGVKAHYNGFAGISVSGEYPKKKSSNNVYIGYCTTDNNPGSPVILNNHSGNGIIVGFCTRATIEYCTASNNGWDMPRIGNGPVGIWCYEADSVIIQHCVSYRNKTSPGGDDGGGYDLDGGVTNSIIQYCLSYENQGSGFGIFQYAGASPWYNNIVRYNISENDGLVSAAHAGFFIWNSSGDPAQFYNCIFYNNTIYNKAGSAINYASQSERKGFSFYNNIFVSGDSLLKGNGSDDIFLANNWWGLKNKFYMEGATDLDAWAKKSGQEILKGKLIGLNINPGFHSLNDPIANHSVIAGTFKRYGIPVNSVLRKKGIDLGKMLRVKNGGVDFNGKQAPVMGIGACF